MNFRLPRINWPTWSRNVEGENFYDVTDQGEWAGNMSNLEMAQNHPILTPALLFVSKVFSQASFSVENLVSGKSKDKHDLISLLKDPNPYQTQEDFLETLMFIMIAQGVAIVYKKTIIGFDTPKQIYILNKDLIQWPPEYSKEKFRSGDPGLLEKRVVYDGDNENLSIKIKDLMFFYDLPNMLSRNPFNVKSRLDGLAQTLINTNDSLTAKNIILKSNGKELITGKKEGFPLSPDEKRDIESTFNNKLGLSFSRKRGVVTQAELTWKSLHIALRDLGLDESVKVDGNLIYTALHIPKDILSLEAKKTTYNNFKESMVSYVQNEMQASVNSAVSVFNKHFDGNYRLKADYSHLPIMQFILLEKYEVVLKRAAALLALRSVGVPDEHALELCGFEKNLELGPILQNSSEDGKGSGSANDSSGKGDAGKIFSLKRATS